LHVTHSTIIDNSTTINGGSGGGIYNGGTGTITYSTIADNSAEFVGGGIANEGSLTVTNSTIRDNFSARGGGWRTRGPASHRVARVRVPARVRVTRERCMVVAFLW
jgi:hypothetical protein